MALRVLPLLLLLLSCATTRTQSAAGGVKDFFLDPAGKVYLLLSDDRLVTGNRLGNATNSFYDSSLGSPDYIDVANPFQVLVYYREYGTVVMLDRTLSELDRIDLFANAAIRQPGAIARSYDNGMWVFDNWSYQLLRLDDRGTVDQQTNDLRLQLNGPGEAAAIFVGRNQVMLHFPAVNRLAVFTNYGEFQRWVDLPAGARLSWNAPRLLAVLGEEAWAWAPDLPAVEPLGPLPETLREVPKVLLGPGGYLDMPDPLLPPRITEVVKK